jgi:hypothetical protein
MKTIDYYVVDSSSLIELNLRYPIDIFPGTWNKLQTLIKKGLLISPVEVFKEIVLRDDSLGKWAKKNKNIFRELDESQIEIVKGILTKYPNLAKSDNEVAAADAFLIALAVTCNESSQKTLTGAVRKNLIVTEERIRGNRVRIPFVCKDYNIACINVIELFRKEGWKFY